MKIRTSAHRALSGATAFTLVELLVVIGIIALLAAIIFPVFAQAREKGRQTACLSNLHQIGTAFLLYTHDNDETFPPSFNGDTHIYWGYLCEPYIKQPANGTRSGTVFTCPSSGTSNLTYSTNPQVVGLFATQPAFANYFQSVVALAQITQPAGTVLMGDALVSPDPGNATGPPRSSDEFAYPHPALRKDHSHDPAWCRDWAVAQTESCNNKQIGYRHSGGANFAFCDGHAGWRRDGQLRDENFDVRCQPGIGCSGKTAPPRPSDYPAVSATCGNQSALNCL